METSDVTHINHTDQVTTIHQLLLHRNTSRGRHDGMIHFYSTWGTPWRRDLLEKLSLN